MEQSELEERFMCDVVITNSKIVSHEMGDIKNWNKEVFVAFYLDSQNKVISREILSIGTLNKSIIHPRDEFRTAVVRNANAIIISHNHPSGSLEPSDEDINTTERLRKAGDLMLIKLIDHVIVTRHGHYSFAEHGMV